MAELKAIDNPLGVDEKTLKDLKITEDSVSPIRKLAYVQEQYDQLETMYWRARVDVIHAVRLQQSDNQVLRNKGLERESTHKNEVEQYYGGMVQIKKLVDQLREQYPELQPEE